MVHHIVLIIMQQATPPPCMSCWTSLVRRRWSISLKRSAHSTRNLALFYWKMTLEPESIALPVSTEKEQKISTQKSSRSGWLEEASSQLPGKPLWRSYKTLSSPPLLVISAPASVLLNYKLQRHWFCLYSLVYPSHTHHQCCFVNSIFVYKFVILYLINIWCLSALFSLCCLTLVSPQLHIIFGFVCALLCVGIVFCTVCSPSPYIY